MAYESKLFTIAPNTGFATDAGAEALGAPNLVPGSGAKTAGVNVHKDYPWTLSTDKARAYVPKLMLTEYKLVLSSEVSGMLYTIRGAEDNLNVLAREGTRNVTNAGLAVAGAASLTHTAKTILPNMLLDKLSDAIGEAQKKVNGVSNTPANANSDATDKAQKNDLTNTTDGLGVYKGLYAIEETGWNYVFPYLGAANMLNPNNQWGQGDQMKKFVGEAMGGLEEAGDSMDGSGGGGGVEKSGGTDWLGVVLGAGKAVNAAAKAGIALGGGLVTKEEPQSFVGTGSDFIECSFYLYNTINVEDIKRNWEFCYLFTYQNLANRKGINLLDPPCMYRALIPGYKQLPICWVTDLSITNVGATKLIDIETGTPVSDFASQENSKVKMVPEAYKVTFILQSALKNARNIFQFAANPGSKVEVSYKKQP